MKSGSFIKLSIIGILVAGLAHGAAAQAQDSRKDATDATKEVNSALLAQLPFNDTSDFDAAHKGFIAALPSEMIKGTAGNAIWNPQKYSFIQSANAPDTVNPSLWRQSRLINISGLFQVADGIYQVRNQDLSNMRSLRAVKVSRSSIL